MGLHGHTELHNAPAEDDNADGLDAGEDKIRKIVIQFKTEAYHFNLLEDGKGNFPVCATKTSDLDKEYFLSKEVTEHGYTYTLVYQNIFDDIDASLEEFRSKIYRTKYIEPKREPISGKMIYFGEDKNKE